MMETISAADAMTRLSELLARVAEGESFLITQQGKPVARLVPAIARKQDAVRAAAERLRAFRGELGDLSVADLLAARHEGHRY